MSQREYLIPEWANVGRIHDWRNYINEPLRLLWPEMRSYVRIAVAENAQWIADKEEWD